MDDYERVICVKQEVFVYKIPPRQSSRGYRGADWKLDQPDWTGRMRIVVVNNRCSIKLEDRNSGELFAQAPVPEYPGSSVESVSDSSRYFVLKIQDESGRHAFIGMGFADRGDSFDFNVSLQDHFKREKFEDQLTKTPETTQKPLDLGFKDGQTIKINFGNVTGEARPKPKPVGGNIGILPPPPGSNTPKLAPPPSAGTTTLIQPPQMNHSIQPQQQQVFNPTQQATSQASTDWGDFAAFGNSNDSTSSQSSNWVQF